MCSASSLARVSLVIWSAAVVAGGCGDDFEPVGGACGTRDPAEALAPIPEGCIVEDTACPAEAPPPGGACSGYLTCQYGPESGPWACSDGRWDPPPSADVPPMGEMCLDPFGGQLDGRRVVLGPMASGPLQPFGDCEPLDLVYGPQGGAMLPFRLQAEGADLPACVLVETRLKVGPRSFDATGSRVALHCGQSMLVYTVVPSDLERYLCDAPDEVVFTLQVDVVGVGSGRARVLVRPPRSCDHGDGTG